MAHSRMPRCHATAWVSKPTTPVAPDPTRGGYSNSRAGPWHQDTPPRRPRRGLVTPVRQAKGVKTGSTQDRSPVVATEVARLHLPSPPDHAKRVQKPSGQIEAFDLARTRTPSSRHERKNQKTSCFTLILLTPFRRCTSSNDKRYYTMTELLPETKTSSSNLEQVLNRRNFLLLQDTFLVCHKSDFLSHFPDPILKNCAAFKFVGITSHLCSVMPAWLNTSNCNNFEHKTFQGKYLK